VWFKVLTCLRTQEEDDATAGVLESAAWLALCGFALPPVAEEEVQVGYLLLPVLILSVDYQTSCFPFSCAPFLVLSRFV
jgi:hypothetical protein